MAQKIKLEPDEDNIVRLPFEFCIQCGTDKSIVLCRFEVEEDNPVAQFATLAGDVSAIVRYVLNKPHTVEAALCERCYLRLCGLKRGLELIHLAGLIGLFVGIATSGVLGAYYELFQASIPAGLGVLSFIGARIYAAIYKRTHSPNITKVNKKKIVIKIPGHGKFICERSQPWHSHAAG